MSIALAHASSGEKEAAHDVEQYAGAGRRERYSCPRERHVSTQNGRQHQDYCHRDHSGPSVVK